MGENSVEWHFSPHAESVPLARQALHKQLDQWRATNQADTAALLLSELASNAYRYGASRPTDLIGVRFALRPAVLRVEVSDPNPHAPGIRSNVRSDDESGRGMLLVSALADDWGVEHHTPTHRKTVWFEIQAPGASC
ncbi:ATP-binding protein [Allostreptomyces psammosilenae]|uniref:Anti-sigma regulatory factor (Ser/Thr protein kinase) n=1 Tax=Allostreptomyces psammosilenae TaxID=1892865 RepID=A0A853A0M7_9ACTN|nr:ATP-binding protein [Allostreptomyces psammosilenae]NYI04371.1 anti-sigma regulatory factor (Ser/Thr protein kinase) [Allostreptomyces psammosilenae]